MVHDFRNAKKWKISRKHSPCAKINCKILPKGASEKIAPFFVSILQVKIYNNKKLKFYQSILFM